MGETRWVQYLRDIDLLRIEGRQQWGENRHQHEAKNDDRPHGALPMLEQIARQAGSCPFANSGRHVGRAGFYLQPGRFFDFAHDAVPSRHAIKSCLILGSTYAYSMSVTRLTNMTSSTIKKMPL